MWRIPWHATLARKGLTHLTYKTSQPWLSPQIFFNCLMWVAGICTLSVCTMQLGWRRVLISSFSLICLMQTECMQFPEDQRRYDYKIYQKQFWDFLYTYMKCRNKYKPEAIHPLRYRCFSFQFQPWKQPSWFSDTYKELHKFLCQKHSYMIYVEKNLIRWDSTSCSSTFLVIEKIWYKGKDHGWYKRKGSSKYL